MKDLDEAKARVFSIASLLRGTGPLVYLDIPVHLNVGDLLINAGTEVFFAEAGLSIQRRFAISDFPAKPAYFPKDTIFVFHGGGNFGDIWDFHQQNRERIIKMYPNNRCVILPQTVHFQSKQSLAQAVRAFSQHPDLHIFARDEHSYQILQANGLSNIAAMPDMAHTLYGTFAVSPSTKAGSLLLIRRDREAAEVNDAIDPSLTPIDWDEIVPYSARVIKRLMVAVIRSRSQLGIPAPYIQVWYPARERIITRAVQRFQQYHCLTTNRLHAMLLGLFLEMDVTAYDNSYEKLSGYCNSWLSDCHNLETRFPADMN